MTSDMEIIEDETLLAVLIPTDLADWLESWADHIGHTVDGAVQVALAGQKARSLGAKMVAPAHREEAP